jgi:hypothetical protein
MRIGSVRRFMMLLEKGKFFQVLTFLIWTRSKILSCADSCVCPTGNHEREIWAVKPRRMSSPPRYWIRWRRPYDPMVEGTKLKTMEKDNPPGHSLLAMTRRGRVWAVFCAVQMINKRHLCGETVQLLAHRFCRVSDEVVSRWRHCIYKYTFHTNPIISFISE